jgi:thiol-disulfide isomerase/thioredoxin
VVNHWATWCIPCIEEFGDLKALHAGLPEGVSFSGISWDLFDPRGDEEDIQEHVANFAMGHDLPWSSLLIGEVVTSEEFFERFDVAVQTVPQTWVLSDSGEVVLRIERVVTPGDIATIGNVVRALISSGAGRTAGGADD